jgi:hypothetical protein
MELGPTARGPVRAGREDVVAESVGGEVEGADVGVVGLAAHHVGALVVLVADVAGEGFTGRVAMLVVHRQVDAVVGAAQVVPAPGRDGQDRGQDEGEHDRDERRIRLEAGAEAAVEVDDGDTGGEQHRAETDRVDGVEHAAAELWLLRRDLQQVLVDDDVRGDDVGTDGEVRQIGDATEGRDRDHPRAPAPIAARREPERVVLQRLLRRPRAGAGTGLGSKGAGIVLWGADGAHRELPLCGRGRGRGSA